MENTGSGSDALMSPKRGRVAIVGGGWAGISAAVQATLAGHRVLLLEASRQLGGRARALEPIEFQGRSLRLDNGQHLLMSAYSSTLELMRLVGICTEEVLKDVPIDLRLPDGRGLTLPPNLSPKPASFQLLWVATHAAGWTWGERLAMLQWGLRWRIRSMRCRPEESVSDLCQDLPSRLRSEWIEPLCISALNLPSQAASGQLFLNVLADTIFSRPSAWRGLVPMRPLDDVFPSAAETWLKERGQTIERAERVSSLRREGSVWLINQNHRADHVILATPPSAAANLVRELNEPGALDWSSGANALAHTAIATVYLATSESRTQRVMHALESHHPWDAQFLFDWQHLGRAQGLLAAVVSHATGSAHDIGSHVVHQVKQALNYQDIQLVKTVVEKRATFAATPNLKRPPFAIAPRLWACGDYISGRYPATIEGAVRSAANIPWRQLHREI